VVDELESPLYEVVVGVIDGIDGGGIVVFHEFGQFLLYNFENVSG
jgi:hypothetical protein